MLHVPRGRWAVGVSGGADSVALLHMLRERDDLELHVVHLDHETREGASAQDAAFVREIARPLACAVAQRSDVERDMVDLPANIPARFRQARFKFFLDVVRENHLDGVILAHHEDDQAETIFQRLLRGSGISGLTGMSFDTRVDELRILRPLLDVRASELRAYLRERKIDWREDESNRSDVYQRNQVRMLLQKFPALREAALELGTSARVLTNWTQANSPQLSDEFEIVRVQKLPLPLARESLRRWLLRQGTDEVTPDAIERLLEMCLDAATPARQQFPGAISARRRGGKLSVSSAESKPSVSQRSDPEDL